MLINRLIKKLRDEFHKAEKASQQSIRAAAFTMGRNIIKRTPVGNPKFWKNQNAPSNYTGGHLRANWQTSINTKASGEINKEQKGVSGIASSQLARVSNKYKTGQTLYMVNNSPYAVRINEGYSVQPGVGIKWVDAEVMKFGSILDRIVRKNKT